MDADDQYRWMTDESEAASGDQIVFADEGEYAGQYADEDEYEDDEE